MEIRDNLNSIDSYNENIDFYYNCISRDLEEYEELKNQWSEERIANQFIDLFMDSYRILISKYSAGFAISDLYADYVQTVRFMEKMWDPQSDYVEMVWMISIGIMIEVDENTFDVLVDILERNEAYDYLTDFLINYKRQAHKIVRTKFKFDKPYKAILEIVSLSQTDKSKAVLRLKNYLEKEWYSGHRDKGWHNDHKVEGIHFGYWSFESGALVKILQLDDSSLKELQYYPYDMVHWKKE